jgi:hypothetical protein
LRALLVAIVAGALVVPVVTRSTLGRRLFIEHEGDVLHTNVAGYIYGDLE